MAAVDAAAMATVATGEMVDALTCQLYKQVGKKWQISLYQHYIWLLLEGRGVERWLSG